MINIFTGLPALGMAILGWLLAAGAGAETPPWALRTILGGEYWGALPEEGYLEYLAAVRPDLIHGGVTGPELASGLAAPGQQRGITPLYPRADSMQAYLAWWSNFNARAHSLGIKVQATHSLTYLWGDPDANTGFFRYCRERWEENLLGPRPAGPPESWLRADAAGRPLGEGRAPWRMFAGCPNNPAWRQAQKAFVRAGLAAGFDGFMVQFPYFDRRCVCPHCQAAFRKFLGARLTPEELAQDCGIADLAAHRFSVIGSPDGAQPRLELAAREFGELAVKDCFDEIFIDGGRRLQPGLVVALWTHFRNFLTADAVNTNCGAIMDERALLPLARWGRGENYIWYSSPVYQSDLARGRLGDAALDYRVLRALADSTPFHVLKYDYCRWRVTVAEALAAGGICFGAWRGGWSGGLDREEPHHLAAYFRFLRAQDRFLNPAGRASYAETALLYPRQSILAGDASFLADFRDLGRALARGHRLFDVLLDEHLSAAGLAARRTVIVCAPRLTAAQRQLLADYVRAGGRLITRGPFTLPGSARLEGSLADGAAGAERIAALAGGDGSRFAAPWTVQVYADRQAADRRLLLHFVNFNRDETDGKRERPLAAEPVKADLRLPDGFRAAGIQFLTPESPAARLKFNQTGARLRFTTPGFLVYGLTVIQGECSAAGAAAGPPPSPFGKTAP